MRPESELTSRCRWHGPAHEFISSCAPEPLKRLVENLGPKGGLRSDWHARGESASWANSLPRLARILERAGLHDCHVILEYNPYQMGRARVDVILAGSSPENRDSYVVLELKQWSKCDLHPIDGRVRGTGAKYEGTEGLDDPHAQARRYATFIRNYTAGMDDDDVVFHAAAYLHNASTPGLASLVAHDWDSERHLFAGDSEGERTFIDRLHDWIDPAVPGDAAGSRLLEAEYEQAPALLEVAAELLTDRDRYPLSDEQNEIFAKILQHIHSALKPTADRREAVIVVKGGPGTGKTWIAMHLLGANAKAGRQVSYATNSTSLRAALGKRAREGMKVLGRPVDALITSARTYWDDSRWHKPLDVLIIDEAHRIAEFTVRAGHHNAADLQKRLVKDNITQAYELKKSARVIVAFIDEDQAITPDDNCTVSDLELVAKRVGASFEELELTEQHRSGGSEAYEQWVDALVAGKPIPWVDEPTYKVMVADSPEELEQLTQPSGTSARLLAGFCWTWQKWPNSAAAIEDIPYDIRIGNWQKRWNLRKPIGGYPKDTEWASKDSGAYQVGSVFTAQGFEFERCGVIIGPDFRWDEGSDRWIISPNAMRYEKLLRALASKRELRERVRNHYRVLLTRAMKTTIIYSTDAATRRKLAELVNP